MDTFKDVVPSLLQTKEYLMSEENEKLYSGYIVNRALSQHIDCIFHVALVNYGNLDSKLQYDYLFHSVKKYKRPYQKWFKNVEDKDIQVIKEYYQCSNETAKQYKSVLSSSDIEELTKRLDFGGKVKNDK